MIKKRDNEPSTAEKMRASRKWTWMVLFIIVIVYFFLYRGFYGDGSATQSDDGSTVILASKDQASEETIADDSVTEIPAVKEQVGDTASEPVHYEFRNKDRFLSHFEKHGEETGHATAEEYLARANEVINDRNALHKNEAEDGDDIYFLEDTGEIVFVSTDGYIRTYFIATRSYFDRQ